MAAEEEDFSLLLFNTISQPPLQEFHRPHKTRNLRLITKFKSVSQYYITIKGPAIQLSPSQLALHKASSHLIPSHRSTKTVCLVSSNQHLFISFVSFDDDGDDVAAADEDAVDERGRGTSPF